MNDRGRCRLAGIVWRFKHPSPEHLLSRNRLTFVSTDLYW